MGAASGLDGGWQGGGRHAVLDVEAVGDAVDDDRVPGELDAVGLVRECILIILSKLLGIKHWQLLPLKPILMSLQRT